jgi:ribonuclease P protein component
MVLLTLESRVSSARLGLSVPRRAGAAPLRNRLKRRLREIFRRSPVSRGRARDLCVIFKPGAAKATYMELAEEFRRLCEKAFPPAPPSAF